MTITEFANMLNGRELGKELNGDIKKLAKQHGFVVVFGDDKNITICGSIDGTVRLGDFLYSDNISVYSDSNGWFANAMWWYSAKGRVLRTNIMHITFDVFKDGEKFSEGIVFDYAKLRQKATQSTAVVSQKINPPQHYLLIYDFDKCFESDNAVSVKDFLLQFLDYTGNNRDLIVKGLNGMTTDQEMVDFINMVTDRRINAVYQVSQTIYKE